MRTQSPGPGRETKPATCRVARPRAGQVLGGQERRDRMCRGTGHSSQTAEKGGEPPRSSHTCTDSPRVVGPGRARPGVPQHVRGRCSEEGGRCCPPWSHRAAQGRVETGRNPAEPQLEDNAVGGTWGRRPGRQWQKRGERPEWPQGAGPCPAWHALQARRGLHCRGNSKGVPGGETRSSRFVCCPFYCVKTRTAYSLPS